MSNGVVSSIAKWSWEIRRKENKGWRKTRGFDKIKSKCIVKKDKDTTYSSSTEYIRNDNQQHNRQVVWLSKGYSRRVEKRRRGIKFD